jgi:predicted phage tail component-like protein
VFYGNNISTDFYTIFNDYTNMEIGIRAIKRPNVPSPEKNIKEEEREGRDEPLTIDEGGYKNITISVPYDFIDRKNFQETARRVKRWINRINDNHLRMSDDLGVFYKVKYAKTDIDRKLNVGTFTIDFICSPYVWIEEGQEEIELSNNMILDNDYEVAKPIYVIRGEGNVTLTVNNKPVVINVGQEVTIDTQLKLCFKNNQMINLALRQGSFEDLYLQEGENTINFSAGTGGKINSIEVIPNWKTI